MQELVGAQPQRGAHGRIEAAQRPLHDLGEQVVEPALRAHGAVDELGGEGAVAVREIGLRQHRGHDDVRERAVLDPHQRVERDAGGSSLPACSRPEQRARRPATGEPRVGRHHPAALGLHLDQLQRAVAGRDAGVPEHGARWRVDAGRQRTRRARS